MAKEFFSKELLSIKVKGKNITDFSQDNDARGVISVAMKLLFFCFNQLS